jgi:integrase
MGAFHGAQYKIQIRRGLRSAKERQTRVSDTSTTPKAVRKKVALRGKDGVYKRGGVWFAIVEYPRDAKTGERIRKRTEGFKTRREAEAERDRIRSEVRSGIDTPPEKITVDALLRRFVAGKSGLSPTTSERYGDYIARVKPHLGSMLVARIRPAHVQALYAELLDRCRICSKTTADQPARTHKCVAGLSSTSVRHLHTFLRSGFAWAVRMQILPRNPLDAIAQDVPQRATPKTDAFTDAEMIALLEAARTTRWDAAIMLALATGMRRGELAALRWSDVTIETDANGVERGSVTITRAFAQTRSAVTLKSTKTGATRTIPLSRLGFDALQRERFRQSGDAFKAEAGYTESGYVFADAFGAPYEPRAFTIEFDKIRRAAGVKKRLHDARHTAASQLLAAGVDVRTVSGLLGHANPSITLNVYSHAIAGLKEDAIERLDARLRAAIDRSRNE